MNRHIGILLLLLIQFVGLSGQNIKIIDSETLLPLEGVFLKGDENQIAFSDKFGIVELNSFGDFEFIEFRLLGYDNVSIDYNSLKKSNFVVELRTSLLYLDQVIVSASRWRQNSSRVAVKISTIKPSEVEFQNPQTAADLLGISGKVFIQKSQQGGGSPMIRGFATNRLIYSVDGVRMNNAIFRGGNIQNVINIDPFTTESTEVLFGPGSVMYGSDAIGGVMNFQSLTPQISEIDSLHIKGGVSGRYSTGNKEQTGHAHFNLYNDKWSFLSSFSSWDFNHLKQGSYGPDDYLKGEYVTWSDTSDVVNTQNSNLYQVPSAYSQINTLQKIRFQPNKFWDFQFSLHYSKTSQYGRYDRHNREKNGLPRYGQWDYGPQLWLMNNFQLKNYLENVFYEQLNVQLAYQRFQESRISRNFNSPQQYNNIEKVDAYSVNVDLSKKIFKNNQVYYGIEYVINDVQSIGFEKNIITGNRVDAASRYPNSRWASFGLYMTDDYQISKTVSLHAGLRYNKFMLDADFSNNSAFLALPFSKSKIDDSDISGSIGIVVRPNEKVVFRSNFSSAFRTPNVDDMGKVFDSEPGSVVVPNIDLRSEKAYNLDFGFAYIFNELFKVEGSAYYTYLDDALVRRDFTLSGQDSIVYQGVMSKIQAVQNAASAVVYGFQGGVEVKLPFDLIFLSDINYQKGLEEMDDGSISPSRHAAPLFGVSRLRMKKDKFLFEFNSKYQGERKHEDLSVDERSKDEIYAKDANGNNYSPWWYTLNFIANYTISDGFVINASVENITDQRYRPYSSGISAVGRNFVFSTIFEF
jgi:hemoglobin/transferrin/lactoferrin receptor protein